MHPKGWDGRQTRPRAQRVRTVEVPRGTQALSRTEIVTIVHEGRRGQVPRPTLLAAIVGKAAAVALPSPDGHYWDLCLFCARVSDAFELSEDLTNKDRQRISKAKVLLDDHQAWTRVPASIGRRG